MRTRRITITDGTEILRTMTVRDDYVELQANGTEVIHDGHYPRNLYDFDGETFTHKAAVANPQLRATSDRNILFVMIKELEQQGLSLPMHDEQMLSKSAAKRLIDRAAGRARFRLVSDGVYVDQEYLIAEQDVDAWIAAGSDENNPPSALDENWLTERNITAAQAATELKSMAAAWKYKLMQIRRLRLLGKASVDNALQSNFTTIAQNYIEQLNAI